MKPPKTFGASLKSLMDLHQLSINALGTELKCKSDLKRVLENTASTEKRQALFDLIQSRSLFSQQEMNELSQGLIVSQIGVSSYLSRLSFDRLLNDRQPEPGKPMRLHSGVFLWQAVLDWAAYDQLQLLCINCCIPKFHQEISSLFQNHSIALSMEHYIVPDEHLRNPAATLYSVAPFLFDTRYAMYTLSFSDTMTSPYFLRCDALIVRKRHKDAPWSEQLFLLRDGEMLYEMPNLDGNQYSQLFKSILNDLVPTMSKSGLILQQSSDYYTLVLSCLGRELNRSSWFIGYDIPFFCLPTGVLVNAIQDYSYFRAADLEWLNKASVLHQRRYQNCMESKKAHYLLFSMRGLETFMATGHCIDHFIGMRDFTLPERLTILSSFLQALRKNTALHFAVYRAYHYMPRYFLFGYENVGVLISPVECHYQIHQASYALAPAREYVEYYREYFLKEMMEKNCLSENDSLDYLEGLYQRYCDIAKPSKKEYV